MFLRRILIDVLVLAPVNAGLLGSIRTTKVNKTFKLLRKTWSTQSREAGVCSPTRTCSPTSKLKPPTGISPGGDPAIARYYVHSCSASMTAYSLHPVGSTSCLQFSNSYAQRKPVQQSPSRHLSENKKPTAKRLGEVIFAHSSRSLLEHAAVRQIAPCSMFREKYSETPANT